MEARNLGELGVNLQNIVSRLTANQNLLKLLYYTDKDPLAGDDITSEQIKTDIFEKLIKVVPLIEENTDGRSIVAIRVADASTISSNIEFVGVSITFEVLVPMTQWIIKNSNLRPFAIMGELQKSLNGKTINGLGKMQFDSFNLVFTTKEMSDYYVNFVITQYE